MLRMNVSGSKPKLRKTRLASKPQMNKREYSNSKRSRNWKGCVN